MAVRVTAACVVIVVIVVVVTQSATAQTTKSPAAPANAVAPPLGDMVTQFIIVATAAAALAFALYWWGVGAKIVIDPARERRLRNEYLTDDIMRKIFTISQRVSDGANAFLQAEYRVLGMFMAGFALFLFLLLGVSLSSQKPEVASDKMQSVAQPKPTDTPWAAAFFSVLCLLIGALASVASGWIGMRIAVFTNSRTAVMATDGLSPTDNSQAFTSSFETAFRGGITMGFALTAFGIFFLYVTVKIGQWFFFPGSDHVQELFECITAFGLGGSAVACFGRIGGGIYTKAADVGSDLVGKLEKNLPEDDARNPGVIADCIGDNVGDIAGMGSDLFGSFGEATCAAMVIAAGSAELSSSMTAMMYPLLVTASGTLVCLVCAYMCATNSGVRHGRDVEPVLKQQLVYSTIGCTVVLSIVTLLALPDNFIVHGMATTKLSALLCVLTGLWSGLIIGYYTEYYTSNAMAPVQEVAQACETGAATNIIYGLSLGYKSVLPPTLVMAVTVLIADKLCGVYGYALAALGILSTMAAALTIDAYGPISDNAGGFAEMAGMGEDVRDVTDALDAAGNTTAAIGKGFAIASAAFVALALYGAFVSRSQVGIVNVLDHRVFPGLLVGGMLPYWFSAMTVKSVGIAAMAMVNEIRRQFQDPLIVTGEREPNYDRCVSIATDGALREMVGPACLVLLAPLVTAILFGKHTLAGLIPGALISGVHMAISSSNSGGAWDNAKKYIERGGLGAGIGKGSPQHKAAVVGDTVGDPLKDTSGPSLNILIKLIAILSLVIVPVVTSKLGGVLMSLID